MVSGLYPLVQMPLLAEADGLSEAVRPRSPTFWHSGRDPLYDQLTYSLGPTSQGPGGTPGAHSLQCGAFGTMLRSLFFYLSVWSVAWHFILQQIKDVVDKITLPC